MTVPSNIRLLMSPKKRSNDRKKTARVLFGHAKAARFESATYYWRRERRNYGDLFRQRAHARLQTVSIEPREAGETFEIARRFGLLGLAKRNRKSHSAAEKQPNAPLDARAKANQPRTGKSKHVKVKNVIRRLKIFRILSERYRHRRKRFGLRFNLIVGLHNYELKLKL